MAPRILSSILLSAALGICLHSYAAPSDANLKLDDTRLARAQEVSKQLGLPMMGSMHAESGVVASTASNEAEIIGTLSYAFGAIWSRPTLDYRERCFISLAVLAAKHQAGPLRDYVGACLRVGAASEDILEAMLQVGVYAGLTSATSGMDIAREVFINSGVEQIEQKLDVVPPLDQEKRNAEFFRVATELGIGRVGSGAQAARLIPLPGSVWTEPKTKPSELDLLQGGFGYGEVWGRARLGYRIRSMITMAVLMTLMENEQFHYHVNNALNLGLTEQEVDEVLLQAGVYAGISCWQNAANVAAHVYQQRAVIETALNAQEAEK